MVASFRCGPLWLRASGAEQGHGAVTSEAGAARRREPLQQHLQVRHGGGGHTEMFLDKVANGKVDYVSAVSCLLCHSSRSFLCSSS